MAALIPLLLGIAPTIADWLFGHRGQEVTARAVQVVQEVTGVADATTADGTAAVRAVLESKPETAEALRVELAKIAAEEYQAANAAMTAQLADVADARRQTVALTGNHSAIAWGAPVVSGLVLVTFGVVMWAAMSRVLPAGSETVVNMLLGTLAAMASAVVSYWVGSSAGSVAKTEMLFRSQPPHGGT